MKISFRYQFIGFVFEFQVLKLCGLGTQAVKNDAKAVFAIFNCLMLGHASANGIVRLAKAMLARSEAPSALREREDFTAKDICDLAREGEEMAAAILDRCGSYLGRAMSYVACTVDPEVFIVGGGMSRAGSVLTDSIRKHYRRFAVQASAQTDVVPARVGNDAGIYGWARMVLKEEP